MSDMNAGVLNVRRSHAMPRVVALLLVTIAVAPADRVHATIPDTNGVFHACYSKSGAVIRIIDSATATCNSNETEIRWNEIGPRGAAGTPGLVGATGPQGPSNAFASDNFSAGFSTTAVSTDASRPTQVVALTLPAGSYVLNGVVGLYASIPGGTLVPFTNVQCVLSNTSGPIGTDFRTLVGGSTTNYASIPLTTAVTLATPDIVTLACVAENGPPVFTRPSAVTAIQVQTLTGP